MPRKNIYDLIEERSINTNAEYARLAYLLKYDYYDKSSRITFYEHIEKELFDSLPIRDTSISLDDLLNRLGLVFAKKKATMDDLFNLIEFLLCVIDTEYYDWSKRRYEKIERNIDIIMNKTSHRIIEYKKGRIVVPNDAKVEEAAILAKDNEISLELLAYNHRSNCGDIVNKGKILNSISKAYEGDLKKDKGELSKNIGFLLNNFDIRHDNKTDLSNNTKFIDGMDEKTLEQWYDNLYTLFIAFIIQSEQKRIFAEIDKIKKKT